LVTDGSQEATLAAEAAIELVNGTGSDLHLVHVVSTAQSHPILVHFAQEETEALLEAKKLHAANAARQAGGLDREELGGKVDRVALTGRKPELRKGHRVSERARRRGW
jgi:nucleotide-binding universal stress UspA family protein